MFQTVQRGLRRLPPWGEVALVLLICFGPPLTSTLGWVLIPREDRVIEMTDGVMALLVAQELICLALAGFVLWCRGWRLADFNAGPTWRRTVAGLGLFLLNLVLYPAIWYIVWYAIWFLGHPSLNGNAFGEVRFEIQMSLALAVVVSVVNATFEELAVVGYLFKALPERFGVAMVFLSAALRTLYHAYQGPIALIAILPMGLLFGYFYYRRRELWSLILAHGIMDLMALT